MGNYTRLVDAGELPAYRLKLYDFGEGNVEACATLIRPGDGDTIPADVRAWFADTRRLEAEGKYKAVVSETDTDVPVPVKRGTDETNAQRSARRAKRAIRFRVLSIAADRMFTFTTRECVSDLETFKGYWDSFRRKLVARYPSWQYVCVPELQKRGAWHLHVACRGFLPVRLVLRLWNDCCGDGNVDVSYRSKAGFRGRADSSSPGHIARYISKYIAKTFDEVHVEGRRYWSTRDIKVPEPERYYLRALCLRECMEETFGLVVGRGGSSFRSFRSGDWGVFWLASYAPAAPGP